MHRQGALAWGLDHIACEVRIAVVEGSPHHNVVLRAALVHTREEVEDILQPRKWLAMVVVEWAPGAGVGVGWVLRCGQVKKISSMGRTMVEAKQNATANEQSAAAHTMPCVGHYRQRWALAPAAVH